MQSCTNAHSHFRYIFAYFVRNKYHGSLVDQLVEHIFVHLYLGLFRVLTFLCAWKTELLNGESCISYQRHWISAIHGLLKIILQLLQEASGSYVHWWYPLPQGLYNLSLVVRNYEKFTVICLQAWRKTKDAAIQYRCRPSAAFTTTMKCRSSAKHYGLVSSFWVKFFWELNACMNNGYRYKTCCI